LDCFWRVKHQVHNKLFNCLSILHMNSISCIIILE
jgi:hypothetical protein